MSISRGRSIRTHVASDNIILVHEGTLALFMIVVVVVVEGLSEEVQTVQMMQPLNICRIPSAILFVDLHLVRGKS